MNFNEIIEHNESLIWMVVNKYSIQGYDKEDLYQECLMKVYDVMNEYNDEFALTTFLYKILCNHLSTLARMNNTQRRTNHVRGENGVLHQLKEVKDFDFRNFLNRDNSNVYTEYENYVIEVAYKLLNELDDVSKDVVTRYIYGETQTSIANSLGVTREAVSKRFRKFKFDLQRRVL